jgi:hypothetical protein
VSARWLRSTRAGSISASAARPAAIFDHAARVRSFEIAAQVRDELGAEARGTAAA